ncbi:MAG: hypothetical protein V3T70_06965, partial [Phycisphaerae bacterium]
AGVGVFVAFSCMAGHVYFGAASEWWPSEYFFQKDPVYAQRFLFMPYCVLIFLLAQAWEMAAWFGAGATGPRPLRMVVVVLIPVMCLTSAITSGGPITPFKDYQWKQRIASARANDWRADIPINAGWTTFALQLRGQ